MMWDDNFKAEDYFFLPPNSTSANLYISAIGDAIDEGSENVTIEIKTIPEPLEAVKKKDNGEIDYSYLFEQYTVDETAASATLNIHDTPISDSDTPRSKTDEDGKTIYKLPSYPYQAGVSITPVNRTGYVEEIRSDSNNNVSLNVVLNSKPTSDVAVLLSTETGTWDDLLHGGNLFFTSDNWDNLSASGKVLDYFWHITLPVIASSIAGFATLTLLTKNSFLDEINKQYVLTAKAKGCLLYTSPSPRD